MKEQLPGAMVQADERSPASGPADAEILRRVQHGDEAAFEQFVQRYGRTLYSLAFYLTGQASDAEDIVQETFLAALERVAKFEARSSVKTWLTHILVKRAARHHRSGRVRATRQALQLSQASRVVLAGSGGSSPQTASEIRIDVLEVLATLRPEYREVIVLRELQGLSYQQIAQVLSVPEGTVESRLFRARQELKEGLKDYLQ